jgi:hypothetical protein
MSSVCMLPDLSPRLGKPIPPVSPRGGQKVSWPYSVTRLALALYANHKSHAEWLTLQPELGS